MLIEQLIEVESRVLGPLVVHIFLKLVISMKKQKSSKANLRVHYFILKMLQKASILISLSWAKSQNLIPKCKILNVFWTSREVKGVICSTGFQTSQILFFQMALKTCKMWFESHWNSHFFPKNYKKSPCGLGAPPPCPLCDMFELH